MTWEPQSFEANILKRLVLEEMDGIRRGVQNVHPQVFTLNVLKYCQMFYQ